MPAPAERAGDSAEVLRLRDEELLSEREIAKALRPTKHRGRSGKPLNQTQVHRILVHASIGEENEMPKKRLREYVPPMSDNTLKATLGEIASPTLVRAATTPDGQPLVDRRAAQEMKRRIVSKPDFTKDGGGLRRRVAAQGRAAA